MFRRQYKFHDFTKDAVVSKKQANTEATNFAPFFDQTTNGKEMGIESSAFTAEIERVPYTNVTYEGESYAIQTDIVNKTEAIEKHIRRQAEQNYCCSM